MLKISELLLVDGSFLIHFRQLLLEICLIFSCCFLELLVFLFEKCSLLLVLLNVDFEFSAGLLFGDSEPFLISLCDTFNLFFEFLDLLGVELTLLAGQRNGLLIANLLFEILSGQLLVLPLEFLRRLLEIDLQVSCFPPDILILRLLLLQGRRQLVFEMSESHYGFLLLVVFRLQELDLLVLDLLLGAGRLGKGLVFHV